MKENDTKEITDLWNEAVLETPSRSLPDYLVFAEKIISREIEIAARLVCFMCNDGNKPQKKSITVWVHIFEGSSGYKTTELCRAGNIREGLE